MLFFNIFDPGGMSLIDGCLMSVVSGIMLGVVIEMNVCGCMVLWYGNSLFDTTYKYTHLNILHN